MQINILVNKLIAKYDEAFSFYQNGLYNAWCFTYSLTNLSIVFCHLLYTRAAVTIPLYILYTFNFKVQRSYSKL